MWREIKPFVYNSSFQPLVSEIDSSISAFGTSIATKKVTICVKNRMINSVNPDETAHDEPSHLDLHSLQKYLFWSTGLKEIRRMITPSGHINLFNCLRHSGKIVDNLLAIWITVVKIKAKLIHFQGSQLCQYFFCLLSEKSSTL